MNKIKGIKRKLQETQEEEEKWIKICQKRIDSFENSEQRIPRLIADHLLRTWSLEAAKEFIKEANLENLVDYDLYVKISPIVLDLEKKQCQEALNWCAENKSRLSKLENDFEYQLHSQVFIELVRKGKKMEAIQYAKKNLKDNVERTKKLMTLLIFSGEDTPYSYYMRNERWNELITDFKETFFQVHGLPSVSPFLILLQSGLISLNAPIPHLSLNDPLSNKKYEELTENLPYCIRRTQILCETTGELMTDENPPMLFPNGNIYSLKSLVPINGKIQDPKTKQIYPFEDLKKLYIM